MTARVLRLCPLLLVCLAVALAGGPASAGGSTFTVNLNTDDDDLTGVDGVCDTFGTTGDGLQCTLRAAIEQANNTPDLDSIVFAIPPGGIQTILPLMALPAITEQVTIDGTTQTNCQNPPCINLDGNSLTMHGLLLNADNSEIRGLIVQRFNGVELDINGDGNTIAGNFFGTDPTGLLDRAVTNGILIHGSNNTFGGTDPADRNIVGGHQVAGIFLIAEAGASNNDILGNYIGVGADGTTPIPNDAGVAISYYNVGRSRVGGSGPPTPGTGNVIGPGNVISGNAQDGICMCEGDGLTIIGNLIGTDATGENAVPNGISGIRLVGSNNIVGGTTVAARNVISGNTLQGIQIETGFVAQANGNIIRGNFIGTDANGEAAVPNNVSGIDQVDASDTTIGGTAPGARNVISGNDVSAIRSTTSTGLIVQGNYIGTDVSGVNAVPNDDRQIVLDEDTNAEIGGSSPGARNVISGGGFDGLRVARSEDVDIIGNYVGLTADGASALGNGRDGIQIGGDNTDIFIQANIVVDSGEAGIGHFFTDGTRIIGNFIGETVSGTPMGNADVGIRVWGSSDLTIGEPGGDGNVISNNGVDGIEIDGNQVDVRARVGNSGPMVMFPSLRNTVRGNSIHSNAGLGINNVDDGNEELPPPVLTAMPAAITGTACADCIIDVYSDDEDEGRIYEGSTVASGGGSFTFSEPMTGPFTTATATDGDGNTSEFSAPVVTPEPATPSPTATPTPTPVSSETPGPTPTSEPTGTPTPTPAGSETPAPEGTQGDTDCDEDVDSVDGLFVLRDVAGLSSSKCIESGDVDCDEDRDSVDALGILRHVAALPPLVQQEPCADIGTLT